jgi:hypothetical protein
LGCDQFNPHPLIHKRPHVQPHPEGTLRRRRRTRRGELLCRRLLKPVRLRNTDCGSHM